MRLSATVLRAFVTVGCSNSGWGKFWQPESAAEQSNTSAWLSFDPRTIGGLRAWFKADTIAQGDGTSVSTWIDSSGTGNTVSAGNSPTFFANSNTINGRPIVRFVSASSQILQRATMISPPGNDTGSFFVVARVTNSTSGVLFQIGGGCDGGRQYSWISATNFEMNKQCFGQVGQFDPLNWTAGSVRQVSVLQNGSSSLVGRANGTPIYSAAPNPSYLGYSNSQLTIGASPGSSGPIDADIAEILFYDSRVSDTEAQNIECYLGAKYGTLACL